MDRTFIQVIQVITNRFYIVVNIGFDHGRHPYLVTTGRSWAGFLTLYQWTFVINWKKVMEEFMWTVEQININKDFK